MKKDRFVVWGQAATPSLQMQSLSICSFCSCALKQLLSSLRDIALLPVLLVLLLLGNALSSTTAVAVTSEVAVKAIGVNTANLPPELYTKAVMDGVIVDDDFNYARLGRISGINIFPQGYRAAKNLVDKVVVYKQRHQMILYKNGHVVRSYWIALSDRPEGHKVMQGDRRTPEGLYTLDYVKENSYYYRAFHISYPNLKDIENARRLGVNPGGLIMVHGQPPSNSEYHETVQRSDWTNGCIAILNPEIDEFISLVDPGTPIEIFP